MFKNLSPRTVSLRTPPTSPLLTSQRNVEKNLSNFSKKDALRDLENTISDAKTRNELVEVVLQNQSESHSKLALKIRFLTALAEVRSTKDKKDKATKSMKLVELFFRKGSFYQLAGISENLRNDLMNMKWEAFDQVKALILSELAKERCVREFLKKTTGVDLSSDENNEIESSNSSVEE